jgi:NADPH:quinone reductase-like Zn-dependent oxidoreductase
MRAAVVDDYGPPEVVHVDEVPSPVPRAGQVLVRVRTAAVTSADARIRGARFPAGFAVPARLVFGVTRPRRRIFGSCFSGVVESVGAGVQGFAPGGEVCGMTGSALGAHAQFLAVPTKRIVAKPPEVSHGDAAGVLFGGTTAWFFLHDKTTIGPGTSVLVNGASGAIGTNAVQLARHLGATVTGVTSTANLALVRELGADRVIDHTQEDLLATSERFDVLFDTVGNLPINDAKRLLRPDGTLLLAVAGLGDTLRARGSVVAGVTPERADDFRYLLQLVADGHLKVVLDRAVDLDGITEAHRRIDSGRKIGNIIVRP